MFAHRELCLHVLLPSCGRTPGGARRRAYREERPGLHRDGLQGMCVSPLMTCQVYDFITDLYTKHSDALKSTVSRNHIY